MNAKREQHKRGAAGGTREERKLRTRHALLEGALTLLEEESFGSLSLREVARAAGIVPTAFYRHFESMEELGLALVDESFRSLRGMLRSAREEAADYDNMIRRSVAIVVGHVQANPLHSRFIARERFSGNAVVRHAIRAELRLFASELATDLVRLPLLRAWSTEDLQMIATLLVNAVVSTTESLLDAPLDNPEAQAEIVRTAEKQLRLVALGIPGWRSGPATARTGR